MTSNMIKVIITLCLLSPSLCRDELWCDLTPGKNLQPQSLEEMAFEQAKTKFGCEGTPCCRTGKMCDKDLGCFEQGTKTPWCHQGAIPETPAKINPEFYVYSPGGREQIIDYSGLAISVNELVLDTSKELWILVHGFGGEWPKTWMFRMKDVLIPLDHNVIIVRWTIGSAFPDYFQAVANTRTMGSVLGRVANEMVRQGKLDPLRTTMVGFSLGAHVAGFGGARVKNLKKVIGLDPAGPLYTGCGSTTRLNHTDASFVMAIHCNGGNIIPDARCGTLEPFADVDFYANGGQLQPGCALPLSTAGQDILHLNFSQIFGELACSHTRCPDLFTTSIINSMDNKGCKYKGYPCNDTNAWLSGKCFSCDSPFGCPTPGYETTNGSPFTGTYQFGTLDTNLTKEGFCGRTYKLTVHPTTEIKGQLLITLIGLNNVTTEKTKIVDGTLNKNETSSHIFNAPWTSEFPTDAVVEYKTSWFILYNKFYLKSITVTREDGKRYTSRGGKLVLRDSPIKIQLFPVL